MSDSLVVVGPRDVPRLEVVPEGNGVGLHPLLALEEAAEDGDDDALEEEAEHDDEGQREEAHAHFALGADRRARNRLVASWRQNSISLSLDPGLRDQPPLKEPPVKLSCLSGLKSLPNLAEILYIHDCLQ